MFSQTDLITRGDYTDISDAVAFAVLHDIEEIMDETECKLQEQIPLLQTKTYARRMNKFPIELVSINRNIYSGIIESIRK